MDFNRSKMVETKNCYLQTVQALIIILLTMKSKQIIN